MARLWKSEENVTEKNGESAPNCPSFLRYFSHFLAISHVVSHFHRIYFWPFLTMPRFPPFPPIFPPVSPILSPFFHFPHFFEPLQLAG